MANVRDSLTTAPKGPRKVKVGVKRVSKESLGCSALAEVDSILLHIMIYRTCQLSVYCAMLWWV